MPRPRRASTVPAALVRPEENSNQKPEPRSCYVCTQSLASAAHVLQCPQCPCATHVECHLARSLTELYGSTDRFVALQLQAPDRYPSHCLPCPRGHTGWLSSFGTYRMRTRQSLPEMSGLLPWLGTFFWSWCALALCVTFALGPPSDPMSEWGVTYAYGVLAMAAAASSEWPLAANAGSAALLLGLREHFSWDWFTSLPALGVTALLLFLFSVNQARLNYRPVSDGVGLWLFLFVPWVVLLWLLPRLPFLTYEMNWWSLLTSMILALGQRVASDVKRVSVYSVHVERSAPLVN